VIKVLLVSASWLFFCGLLWLLGFVFTFIQIMPVIPHVELALGVLTVVGEIVIINNHLKS
jgi:hypothetical protein